MPSRQNSNDNNKNIFGASKKKDNLVIMPFHAIEENQKQIQFFFYLHC